MQPAPHPRRDGPRGTQGRRWRDYGRFGVRPFWQHSRPDPQPALRPEEGTLTVRLQPTLPMIKVTAFAYTCYPVTDMARARAFYETLLGLKPSTVWDDNGKGWIEYELGESCLAIANGFGDDWKPAPEGGAAVLEI